MFKKLCKNSKFWLLLIMGLGLLLRLYKISSPILDLYPTRQEQCAMIARNFYRHGFNIFQPQVDWFGPFDSSWRLELPLASYITALLYILFGIREFLGRLVNIAFSLGSIYFLYQFTSRLLNRRAALYAGFLFAVSPLSLYFGRAFMSEAAMIFFSIASLYYFYQWIQLKRRSYYLCALLATALTFLTKLQVFICLPLLYLAYTKYGKRVLIKPSVVLFFILSLLPSLLWYSKASDNVMTYFVLNKINPTLRLDPDFYLRIFESVGVLVLTPLGAFLALCGFTLSVYKREEYLVQVWLLAMVVYTLLVAHGNYVHYYYQLPYVPLFTIAAAKALDRFNNRDVLRHTIFRKFNTNFLVGITLGIIALTGFLTVQPFYKWNRSSYRAFQMVKALTEEDAIVIAGKCKEEAPLYYTDRKGWMTNEYPDGSLGYSWARSLDKYNFPERAQGEIMLSSEVELVKFLIKHGADYYFTVKTHFLKQDPYYKDFMYKNFKVVKEEEGFVLFDLKAER